MTSRTETLSARIFRYDPAVDALPRYDTVEVPWRRNMRVLDVLDYAAEHHGLGVGYRYFCGIKRCGMCGVSVDGKPALACWEPARPSMVIDPMPKMPVIRDLAVDRSEFEGVTVSLDPCLSRGDEPYEGFPEPVTHVEMQDAFKLMNCIECYVCTASCPAVPDEGPRDFDRRDFVGPGTLVQIAKAALHPKDRLDRSGILETGSLDNCMSCGRCEEVCPNGIPVLTGAVLPMRAIAARGPRRLSALPLEFAGNVRAHADLNSAALFLRTKKLPELLASIPMLLRMFLRRKTRLFAHASREARRGVQAVFGQAGNGSPRRASGLSPSEGAAFALGRPPGEKRK